MALPWNNRIDRSSPRQWLIRQLAGEETVVLNARFTVRQVDDGLLATLDNFDEGSSLVAHTVSLGIPGRGRLEE